MHIAVADDPIADAERVSLQAKIRLLSDPATYGAPLQVVERIETHMSLLFVAGDLVYKLKKPVAYPFLDFRTLPAREHCCRDEIRLNRRLAPGVYLGLSTINRDETGALALDGPGDAVDWLVRMRRLHRDLMLDRAIANSTVTDSQVDAVGALLADFYRRLPPSTVSADDYVALLQREHAITCRVVSGFDREVGDPLLAAVQRFLDHEAPTLRARVRAGRIIDGHGDLRPEHVCLSAPPVIIDCLEFNHALRQVDPFDEVVFLGLDCARLGAPWIGSRLLQCLRRALGNAIDPQLLRFYARYRACVRARLALAHLTEPTPREPARWQPQARAYLQLATELPPFI